MITYFFDMSSGGSDKEDWAMIGVNLPNPAAVAWFEDTFGHHPNNITCDCCGPDYSIGSCINEDEFYSIYPSYSRKLFTV